MFFWGSSLLCVCLSCEEEEENEDEEEILYDNKERR